MVDDRDPQVGRKPLKSRIIYAVALAGTFGILYLLIGRLAGVGDFWGALQTASPGLVAAAAAVVMLNALLAGWRIMITFGVLGAQVPFWRAAETVLASFPLAVITPSRAGDAARAVALRDLLPIPEGVSAVLAEKLVDVHSLLVMSCIGAAATGLWGVMAVAAGLLVAQYVTSGLLVRYAGKLERLPLLGRFGDKPRRLVSGLAALVGRPRQLLLVMAVSLTAFTNAIAVVYLLLLAVGAELPFGIVMALWPVSLFAGLLPITIGGIGTRDGTFVGLLTLAGVAFQSGSVLAATVLYAVVATALPALLGIGPMLKHARALTVGASEKNQSKKLS